MITYTFIAASYGLKLSHVMNKGTKLYENLRVTNDSSHIESMFSRHLKNIIGSLEYDQLHSGPYYYAKGKLEGDAIFLDEKAGLEFLEYFMRTIQTVNNLLWLIKDHSINTELGFIEVKSGPGIKWHSNSRVGYYFNSQGKKVETEFSVEEIKDVVSLLDSFFKNISYETSKNEDVSEEAVYKAKRVERVFYFLQAARTESYLPDRISGFVTLLETLLSTSSIEVTHKLKERMAWMLGKDFKERQEIFKNMGEIYSIRSANVHGNKMPKQGDTTSKLERLSIQIEDYARRLIMKIITEDEILEIYNENNDQKIELWLQELCLGKDYKE